MTQRPPFKPTVTALAVRQMLFDLLFGREKSR